ncbi:MAG: hypothetical protein FJZ56_04125 [Chlamydiae bacterium]|nr:hypothetical protein [Chlamydiota bacterium]
MAHPKTSFKRARSISLSLFLAGLAIVSFTNTWWPGIMLAIGLPLSIKQYLEGKNYDAIITFFIFSGFFVMAGFDISWEILMPVLFLMAAFYILIKEFFNPFSHTTSEEEESLSHEIEEEEKK